MAAQPRKPRLWRDLSETTKKRYRRQGVTPSAYNAWNRKTRPQKLELKSLFPNLTGPGAVHARSQQRRGPRMSPLKERAYQNILNVLDPYRHMPGYLKHRPNDEHIQARVNAMSRDELVIASVADIETFRQLASNQQGWRTVNGERVNPFWYN